MVIDLLRSSEEGGLGGMATGARLRDPSSVFFFQFQSHYRDRVREMGQTGHHSTLKTDEKVVEPLTALGQSGNEHWLVELSTRRSGCSTVSSKHWPSVGEGDLDRLECR